LRSRCPSLPGYRPQPLIGPVAQPGT
jgi:hypothetical protein